LFKIKYIALNYDLRKTMQYTALFKLSVLCWITFCIKQCQ